MFDIFNDISDHGTLVQLLYRVVDVNYSVSISECCIYVLNYNISLSFMKQSLDIICSCSAGDSIYADFKMVYYSVRYMNLKARFKCSKWVKNYFDVQI